MKDETVRKLKETLFELSEHDPFYTEVLKLVEKIEEPETPKKDRPQLYALVRETMERHESTKKSLSSASENLKKIEEYQDRIIESLGLIKDVLSGLNVQLEGLAEIKRRTDDLTKKGGLNSN